MPMEPPTATMAICPALSWWWSPSSWIWADGASGGMENDIKCGEDGPNAGTDGNECDCKPSERLTVSESQRPAPVIVNRRDHVHLSRKPRGRDGAESMPLMSGIVRLIFAV